MGGEDSNDDSDAGYSSIAHDSEARSSHKTMMPPFALNPEEVYGRERSNSVGSVYEE